MRGFAFESRARTLIFSSSQEASGHGMGYGGSVMMALGRRRNLSGAGRAVSVTGPQKVATAIKNEPTENGVDLN